MSLIIRYARLAGGNDSVDLDACRQYLSCVVVGNPPIPRSDTLKFFYLLPNGERWIQAFGNHLPQSRSGYWTKDVQYVPADMKPDAIWNFFELHRS